jgi:hypothetical protein
MTELPQPTFWQKIKLGWHADKYIILMFNFVLIAGSIAFALTENLPWYTYLTQFTGLMFIGLLMNFSWFFQWLTIRNVHVVKAN